ncbi:hypothetical protein ACVIEM_005638 [Rhizobium leguminosarum]
MLLSLPRCSHEYSFDICRAVSDDPGIASARMLDRGGLMAVLGAAEDIKHIQIGRTSQLLTTVFTGAGVTSAVAMIAVLVFVWL